MTHDFFCHCIKCFIYISQVIWVKHGSGTYIQKKNFVAHIDHMNSFSEIAHKSGKEAGSQIMKFEVQDASPTIATELNLVPGEQVYYIKRLRFIEDNAAHCLN